MGAPNASLQDPMYDDPSIPDVTTNAIVDRSARGLGVLLTRVVNAVRMPTS